MRIDINSDMGESFGAYTIGRDAGLMNAITSANVACGLHAGDPSVMDATITLAISRGVRWVRTRAPRPAASAASSCT